MTPEKTERNEFDSLRFDEVPPETERELLLAVLERLDVLGKQLDHADEGIHALDQRMTEVHQFFTDHKTALARAASLLDAGKGLGAFMGGRKGPKDGGH